MHKLKWKRKRVTVMMDPELYGVFHGFAERRAWSDGKAGLLLLTACFKGSVAVLLAGEKISKVNKALGIG